jgi:hypothetical protein
VWPVPIWQLVPSGRDWMVAWGGDLSESKASRQRGGLDRLVGSLGPRGLARGLEGGRERPEARPGPWPSWSQFGWVKG